MTILSLGTFQIIIFSILLIWIISWWKVFEKAGWSGWLCLIPILNVVVVLKIAGKPSWWFFLLLVPLVNLVVYFLVARSFTKRFGDNSILAALGMTFVSIIYIPLLAFDNQAVYKN